MAEVVRTQELLFPPEFNALLGRELGTFSGQILPAQNQLLRFLAALASGLPEARTTAAQTLQFPFLSAAVRRAASNIPLAGAGVPVAPSLAAPVLRQLQGRIPGLVNQAQTQALELARGIPSFLDPRFVGAFQPKVTTKETTEQSAFEEGMQIAQLLTGLLGLL